MEMEFYRNNEIVDRQESPEQQIVPVQIIPQKQIGAVAVYFNIPRKFSKQI